MGKENVNKKTNNTSNPSETHEPAVPDNWPHGHVSVSLAEDDRGHADVGNLDIDVMLTDSSHVECLAVQMGGTRHYLHSTTARELSNMLLDFDGSPVVVTVHGVEHTAGVRAARTLSGRLMQRLDEWNAIARKHGAPGV